MAQPLSPGSNRNGNRFRIVYCCLALLIVLQPARIRGQQEVPLEPDRPIERELAGGQSHLYQFMLEAGQYVKITIEQRGIDVMARLSGLGGKESAEFDSEIRNQGTEVVEWVAEAAGPRQLVVQSKQKDAAPGRYEIRLATPRAATADETALNEALRLYEEHLKLRREAKYDQALPLVERSLQIRERVLGPDHRLVANSVNGLAIIYSQKGEYAKAAPLFLRALTVLEKVLGPDHLQVSNLLNNLGNFYYLYGKYPEAERFHRRALTIRERAPGAEPLLVAQSLHNLGSVYDVLGDYVRAESAYQRALNIREKALGAEHILVADTAYNLGLVYDEKGDLARAEPLHRRALAIREKLLGPEHPDVAASLDMLASCYLAEDRESEARQSLQRALEIREKVLGPDHPEVAVSLNNLAMFHDEHGDNAKAEQMARRALVIKERAFGSEHPETAWTLNVLGNIYRDSGEYAKARPLLRRALEIQERAGGPQHPQVAVYLGSLARVYAAEGDLAQAISIQSRANAVSEHHLVLNLAVGSERQKLRYLALFSKETDYTLTLHDRAAPDNPQALELAFTTLLRRKGRGLDAVTDTVAALRRRAASEDQQLFDRLAETRSQLAGLILKAPGPDNPEAYRTQLAALEETSERLESELSSRSREFGQQLQPATIAAVQAALPAGCALIEFAVYTPEDLRTGKRQSPRYLAY
ncbi:MAG TPA: tetratricopeptide repeat-containing protein, partial [Blastocatellia bacterium]|nr:tetratricopeptide repeat-containing protein [Blastocatellia bacterium]